MFGMGTGVALALLSPTNLESRGLSATLKDRGSEVEHCDAGDVCPVGNFSDWKYGCFLDADSSAVPSRSVFGGGTDCGQASRAISTAQLHMSPCFHLPPINVIVSHDPLGDLCPGNAHLGGGFPLRCFQRLSLPNVATRQCHWRDNRYTSGWSFPVLSY